MKEVKENAENTLFSDILEDVVDGRNIIFHSSGGTGKSYTLRKIAQRLISMEKKVFMTALTGVAAVNLGECSSSLGEDDELRCSSSLREDDEFRCPPSSKENGTGGISCKCTTLHSFAGILLGQGDVKRLIARIKSRKKTA